MSRRRIGQEAFGFGDSRGRRSSLDGLAKLIDWSRVEAQRHRQLSDVATRFIRIPPSTSCRCVQNGDLAPNIHRLCAKHSVVGG